MPFSGAVRVVMLALAIWAGGVGPVMAASSAALSQHADGAAAADPCPGCPDDEDGTPCGPTCTDCACLPFSRSLPAPSVLVTAPVLTLLAPAAHVVPEVDAPTDPPGEAVFHPPRR